MYFVIQSKGEVDEMARNMKSLVLNVFVLSNENMKYRMQ